MSGKKKLDKKSKKILFASLLGSTIEFYDFFLYGTVAALVFNKLYFPNDDPFVSLLLAYASFGITFLYDLLEGLYLVIWETSLAGKILSCFHFY